MSLLKRQFQRLSDFQAPVGGGEDQLRHIATDLVDCKPQIRSSANPGFSDESLRELGVAIQGQGQLQPVLLRPNPEAPDRFLMIAGERRLRAAQLMQLPTILARVYDVDAAGASRLQRAENTHREALTQLEQAQAVTADYKRLGSLDAVAAEWGKSLPWVSQAMAFVKAIDAPSVQLAVTEGLTSDKTIITSLARLEAKSPEAARKVVEILRETPNANARQVLNDASKRTKATGGNGASPPGTPVKADGTTIERSIETLLAQLYTAQFTENQTAQAVLTNFTEAEQARIEKVLRKCYDSGRETGPGGLTEAVLTRARRGEITEHDARLYRIVAFLEGATGAKSATLPDLIHKAASSRGPLH